MCSRSYKSAKLLKHGVFSGTNVEKYGPDKTPYLDTFHTVRFSIGLVENLA